jgi:hypothetical protein
VEETNMSRVVKLALTPFNLVWIVGVILAVAIATGVVKIPGVSAQVALDCPQEQIINNECVQDACWNLEGFQAAVTAGYHIDESQNNACIEDPQTSTVSTVETPQVLGTSSQVLAETDGK